MGEKIIKSELTGEDKTNFLFAVNNVYRESTTFSACASVEVATKKSTSIHHNFHGKVVHGDGYTSLTAAQQVASENRIKQLTLIEIKGEKGSSFVLKETVNGVDCKPLPEFTNITIGIFGNIQDLRAAIENETLRNQKTGKPYVNPIIEPSKSADNKFLINQKNPSEKPYNENDVPVLPVNPPHKAAPIRPSMSGVDIKNYDPVNNPARVVLAGGKPTELPIPPASPDAGRGANNN